MVTTQVTVTQAHWDAGMAEYHPKEAPLPCSCVLAQALRDVVPGKPIRVGSQFIYVGDYDAETWYPDKTGRAIVDAFDAAALSHVPVRVTLPKTITITKG